jgi:SNF2 family DNA or RNA helicase
MPWGWDLSGATNLDELTERMKTTMIRHTRREVLDQLPDLTRTYLPVDITNEKEYKQALSEIQKLIRNQQRAKALVRLSYLRQAVGRGKVKAAITWSRNFLKSTNEKLVLYAHHKDVVRRLCDALAEFGVQSITGDVGNKERQRRVDAFQNLPRPRVMVLSSAGGEGIDLFKASNILFVEREWTPAAEEQAEARLNRIGQKSAVTAWYLIARGTVDEYISRLIDDKRRLLHEVIRLDDVPMNVMDDLLDVIGE